MNEPGQGAGSGNDNMAHSRQKALRNRTICVTCERKTQLRSKSVESAVVAFLQQKVLPVVGDNCRINLHWNGLDLLSLHIRSVVPNHCVLRLKQPISDATRPKAARKVATSAQPPPPPLVNSSSTPIVPPEIDISEKNRVTIKCEPILDEHNIKEESTDIPHVSNSNTATYMDQTTAKSICDTGTNMLAPPTGTRPCSTPGGKQLPQLRPKPAVLSLTSSSNQIGVLSMVPIVAHGHSPCTSSLLTPIAQFTALNRPQQFVPPRIVSGQLFRPSIALTVHRSNPKPTEEAIVIPNSRLSVRGKAPASSMVGHGARSNTPNAAASARPVNELRVTWNPRNSSSARHSRPRGAPGAR